MKDKEQRVNLLERLSETLDTNRVTLGPRLERTQTQSHGVDVNNIRRWQL